MCVLERLKFKISRRSMPPDPPSVLTPPKLDPLSACQLSTASTDHVVMPKMVTEECQIEISGVEAESFQYDNS